MISFLLFLSYSKVIQLNENNYLDYVNVETPAIVEFSNSTNSSFNFGVDFWEDSLHEYEGKLNFCSVDCSAHKNLCKNIFHIESPIIALFYENSIFPLFYEKEMNVDNLGLFISEFTNTDDYESSNSPFEITPNNFESWKKSKKCAFAVYYSSIFDHHKTFINEAMRAAEIFDNEPNVTIGIIKCDKYRSLCSKIRDDGYPLAIRYMNNNPVPFTDMPLLKFILADINDNCDTHRQIDGSLTDNIGVIPELQKYVKPFLDGDKETKKKIASELTSLDKSISTSIAVFLMINNENKMDDQITQLEAAYHSKTIGKSQRDIFKKAYNVVRVFYPKSPTPTPTPRPAPTPIPNPLKQKGIPIIRPLPINHNMQKAHNQAPPKPGYMEL